MPPTEKHGKQVELVDQANQLISTEAYLRSRKKLRCKAKSTIPL